MKTRTGLLLLVAVVGLSGAASAEEFSGRVSNINYGDGTVRILRNDTNDYFSVNVRDRNQLNSLRNGSVVSFQANQVSGGAWETSAFRPSSTVRTTAPASGSGVDAGTSSGMNNPPTSGSTSSSASTSER